MNHHSGIEESCNWDVTLQTHSKDVDNPATNNGCLVKIHPMELDHTLVRLTQPTTTIGRAANCDLFCDDPSISRRHAEILKTCDGFFLQDCNSTNGTFVDGRQITKTKLADNVQIRIGNHIFKFLADDSIESQYHETVYNMMTKDGLTGTYNKRYMVETLEREFERSRYYGRPFSVIMMDIDFFKKLNDTHGHLAGDEVLQQFAARVQRLCKRDQILARFGGEEFAILLSETKLENATIFAEKVRALIADQSFECTAGSLPVTASIGVAEMDPKSHSTFADLLEKADQHLYQAKQSGRNRVCNS